MNKPLALLKLGRHEKFGMMIQEKNPWDMIYCSHTSGVSRNTNQGQSDWILLSHSNQRNGSEFRIRSDSPFPFCSKVPAHQPSASRNHNICTKNSGVFKKARRTNPAKSSQIQPNPAVAASTFLPGCHGSEPGLGISAGWSLCLRRDHRDEPGGCGENSAATARRVESLWRSLHRLGMLGRGLEKVLKGLRDPKIGCSG